MSIGHQFSQTDWIGKGSGGSNHKLSRQMKTALAVTTPIGVGIWPIVISSVVAGPIGFLVSGAITLGTACVSAGITYAVTEDD